uniref:Solute carrier family 25 member 44-like n=1 Tax=Nelumbo nucifera TaxID=4432 RepID=A0A822ZLJ8_NELNU|nr:TPA_asm: hypothetical protein HUJ06_002565 [Nelumbo nucifera]
MLDKSKFFFLGAALFSGVSSTLYPVVVLKTRQQVSQTRVSCMKTAYSILRHEGFRGLYRGFGTSLMGTIPARALYMTALEVTKSNVGTATIRLGLPEPTAAAIANAAAGLSAAMASQLVWTPIDVVSQRLMVQSNRSSNPSNPNMSPCKYHGGIDAFRKILRTDGLRGLYRGFGISILTYAPSNAAWWASYSVAQRLLWGGISCYFYKKEEESRKNMGSSGGSGGIFRPDSKTIGQTVRNLVREGGWTACYRGVGPRWASMSMSATTMITTYEFLKRLSAKNQENLT